jgi:hypothetical protein
MPRLVILAYDLFPPPSPRHDLAHPVRSPIPRRDASQPVCHPPEGSPGTSGDNYFTQSWSSLVWTLSGGGGWTLAVHASIAVALLIGTIALFVRTLSPPGRGWRWGSGIAALFTLGALFNGLSFADYNQDFSSMIMVTCWLVAVTAVVIPLTRSRTIPTTQGISSTQ